MACTSTRSLFAHKQQTSDSVFHSLARANIVFIQSKRLALNKQCRASVEVFLAMRKCVCGEHIKHIAFYQTFREYIYTLRPPSHLSRTSIIRRARQYNDIGAHVNNYIDVPRQLYRGAHVNIIIYTRANHMYIVARQYIVVPRQYI